MESKDFLIILLSERYESIKVKRIIALGNHKSAVSQKATLGEKG